MPLYDFKCTRCRKIEEKLVLSTTTWLECPTCHYASVRQLSAPGGIKVNGRMVLSQSQMRMIKEPVWQYPDGSVEAAH